MNEKKIILFGLYFAIFSQILLGFAQDTFKIALFTTIFSYSDEIYSIILLIYTIFKKGFTEQKRVLTLIILLWCVGLISGINSNFNLLTNSLGAFNFLKGLIIYICLCQYKFSLSDFKYFMNLFIVIIPFVIAFYILDIIIPNLRQLLNFQRIGQTSDFRLGFRSLGGLFSIYTHASLFGLIYFIIYTYYKPKVSQKKWYQNLGLFMIIVTQKVKDIFSIAVVYCLCKIKHVRPISILLIMIAGYVLFGLYAIYLPNHYNTYFGRDADTAVRNLMTEASLQIANNHIPLGVGWGKFGSATSAHIYSEVYGKYKLEGLWGLNYEGNHSFMQDTQWPMLFGETGYLGTIIFLLILFLIFAKPLKHYLQDTSNMQYAFPSVLFIYYIICSLGKPVFVAIPHSYVIWGISAIWYSLATKFPQYTKSKKNRFKHDERKTKDRPCNSIL